MTRGTWMIAGPLILGTALALQGASEVPTVPGRSPAWPVARGPAEADGPETRYAEGPPPAHTGGFGEPTCFDCHWDGELNQEGGALELDGVPERIEEGRRYELVVRVTHPDLESAGFQLSARFAAGVRRGRDAGVLEPGAGQEIATGEAGEVSYLRQTGEGTRGFEDGRAEWRFGWVAPADTTGPVVFHAAANAANGDVSEFGDRIYTLERTVSGSGSGSDNP